MLRKLLISVLLLALFGLVVLPALAYTVGQFVIGPYEGPDGLVGYLMSIYRALADGSPGATILVSTPLGIAVGWWITGWLLRRQRRTAEEVS